MNEQDSNRDELLNSFVDGELSPRQRTEVKRLAVHDQSIAERIRRIENVRNLLRSLPREDPPEEIADNVRLLLERQSLLGERDAHHGDRRRHYAILSKVRAVAAVLLLMGALVVLIHNIISPLDSPGDAGVAQNLPQDEVPDPGPAPVTTIDSTYELHMAKSTDLAHVLDEAVADLGLTAQVSRQIQTDQEIYRFECEKQDLGKVLASLQRVWGAVDSARFVVSPGPEDAAVVVESADPRMVARVLDQDTPAHRFSLAQKMAAAPPDRVPLATGDVPPITRPVLTSGAEVPQGMASMMAGKGKVRLTIELNHDSPQ